MPELEMILIIAEGMFKDYEKDKSTMSPKEFAKVNIKLGKRKYDNSSRFYADYFSTNIQLLVQSIKEYQRVKGKTHEKDEHCLSELLKFF